MKRILSILFVFGAVFTYGQQLPHYTQYLINDYVTNPAIGGTSPYFKAQSNHRFQWVGITDAPRTYIFSLHGPIVNDKMGVGGYVFTDFTGPTRRSGFQASYSYKVNITDDIKLSFGLAGGLLQFAVDGGKVNLEDINDLVLSTSLQSSLVLDMAAGLYLYEEDRWFFSVSAPQLVGSKLQFFDAYTNTLSRLSNHYFAAGGYTFDISSDFQIQPSFLIKYISPVPIQVDANVRAIYQENVWVGLSYRSEDAIGAMLGYNFKERFMFGYSYDFPISNLRKQSTGSHELMVGFRFLEN
jgi:type IX secretion system PorP/SprF family membrane protein